MEIARNGNCQKIQIENPRKRGFSLKSISAIFGNFVSSGNLKKG